MESYYVTAEHLREVYQIPLVDAESKLAAIFNDMYSKLRQKFMDKRRDANLKYWRDGGGPASNQIWPEGSPVTSELALGKEVLSKVNEAFGAAYGGRKNPFDSASKKLSEEIREFFVTNQLTDVIQAPGTEVVTPVIDANAGIL
jgi:hypothetical protein